MAIGLLVAGCGDNVMKDGGTADLAMGSADLATAPDLAMVDPKVAQGQGLATKFGCVNCHQSASAADGTLSGSTVPRPMSMAFASNLTPDKTTGIGTWTSAQIVAAIRTGVANDGRMLCPQMPRYASLTDDQVGAIVAYLQSLPAVAHAIPASMCPPTDGGPRD